MPLTDRREETKIKVSGSWGGSSDFFISEDLASVSQQFPVHQNRFQENWEIAALSRRKHSHFKRALGKGGDLCHKDRRSPSHLTPCDSKRTVSKV